MSIKHRTRTVLAVAALSLAVTAAGASAGEAGAAPKRPKVAFTAVGSGTWEPHPSGNGDALATAPGTMWRNNTRELPPVTLYGNLSTDDRTLPEPGECEHAFGTITAVRKGVVFHAVGDGQVCGHEPAGLGELTHAFTGRFEVIRGAQRFVGVDGFFQIQLYDGGGSYLLATDS